MFVHFHVPSSLEGVKRLGGMNKRGIVHALAIDSCLIQVSFVWFCLANDMQLWVQR